MSVPQITEAEEVVSSLHFRLSSMFIPYIILLFLYSANGLPIPSNRASEPSQVQPAAANANLKRTLFKIIWNCLATIIICAWVSVHPNVPPSGYWRALRQRLKTMIWTIIAPELILAWAVRQWFAAREIRDTVNGTSEVLQVYYGLQTC